MEFNLRVIQLEEDLVKLINESGLPSTVVNLIVQKVSGNINMSVNMQLEQHKEEVLNEEKLKEVQDNEKKKKK